MISISDGDYIAALASARAKERARIRMVIAPHLRHIGNLAFPQSRCIEAIERATRPEKAAKRKGAGRRATPRKEEVDAVVGRARLDTGRWVGSVFPPEVIVAIADENDRLRAENADLLRRLEHSDTHKALDAMATETGRLRTERVEVVALFDRDDVGSDVWCLLAMTLLAKLRGTP